MYIKSKEAMELLCVSRTQLHRMMDKGLITAYKPAGRLLFDRAELLGFIKSSKLTPSDVMTARKNRGKRKFPDTAGWTGSDYKKFRDAMIQSGS